MCEGIFKAFRTNITREADSLSFASGATLLREEGFRIGLGTERALLPGEFNGVVRGWQGCDDCILAI